MFYERAFACCQTAGLVTKLAFQHRAPLGQQIVADMTGARQLQIKLVISCTVLAGVDLSIVGCHCCGVWCRPLCLQLTQGKGSLWLRVCQCGMLGMIGRGG